MARRLLNLLTILSLVLCVAVVVLWVRSRKNPGSFSFLLRRDRYTLISEAGGVALYGPPPPAADPAVRREIAGFVARLDNDQIAWDAWVRREGARRWMEAIDPPETLSGTAAMQLQRFAPRDVARPLLAALEDPRTATAAHVLLAPWDKRQGPACVPLAGHVLPANVGDYGSGPEGRAPWTAATYQGMTFTLNRWLFNDGHEAATNPITWRWGLTSLAEWDWGMAGDPDAADLPRARAAWHRKLDVRLASAPYWALVAATASLPLASAYLYLRSRPLQRRRAARGQCVRCGYDLTANVSGVCPECGQARSSAPGHAGAEHAR